MEITKKAEDLSTPARRKVKNVTPAAKPNPSQLRPALPSDGHGSPTGKFWVTRTLTRIKPDP